ncbi:hypothetical protein VCHA57P527_170037 [Vibrio chagasii]|nr:hypothetical protein VCHA57P527_170037 [Vibrio chagasii]
MHQSIFSLKNNKARWATGLLLSPQNLGEGQWDFPYLFACFLT